MKRGLAGVLLVVEALGIVSGCGVSSEGVQSAGASAKAGVAAIDRLRAESEESDDYSNVIITMSAEWPASREEADSTLSRLGFVRELGGKTGAVSYDKKDSVAEIGLLVNVDAGLFVGKYRPVHVTPMSDELLRMLKEKSAGTEFFPPDEFQYRLVESLDGWNTETYVGVGMPSGAWRYTHTTMRRVSGKP